MYRRYLIIWFKRIDFIVLNLLSLQISFIFSFWLICGSGNHYANPEYVNMAFIMMLIELVTVAFFDGGKDGRSGN